MDTTKKDQPEESEISFEGLKDIKYVGNSMESQLEQMQVDLDHESAPSSPLPSPPPCPPPTQQQQEQRQRQQQQQQQQQQQMSAPSPPSSPLPNPPPFCSAHVAPAVVSVDGIPMIFDSVSETSSTTNSQGIERNYRFAVPSPINTRPLSQAAAMTSPPQGVRAAYIRRQSMSVFSPLSRQVEEQRRNSRKGKGDYVTPMTGYQEENLVSPGQRMERGFFSRESRYLDRYMFLLCWLGFLFVGWGTTRLLCVTAEFPKSCNTEISGKQLMEDVQALFLFGMVMAWMCSITSQWRFWNLFSKRRWYFFVFYFGTILAFPGLTTALQLGQESSLKSAAGHSDPPHWIVLTAVGIGGGFLVIWHVWHARSNFRQTDVLCYAVTRLCVLLFYIIQAVVVLTTSRSYVLHFHHWLIGFALSLFCQFDHWISILCLGVTMGLFAQGLGAFGYASMFTAINNENCVYFTSSSSTDRAPTSFFACNASEPFYATMCLTTQTGGLTTDIPSGMVCSKNPSGDSWQAWPHQF